MNLKVVSSLSRQAPSSGNQYFKAITSLDVDIHRLDPLNLKCIPQWEWPPSVGMSFPAMFVTPHKPTSYCCQLEHLIYKKHFLHCLLSKWFISGCALILKPFLQKLSCWQWAKGLVKCDFKESIIRKGIFLNKSLCLMKQHYFNLFLRGINMLLVDTFFLK